MIKLRDKFAVLILSYGRGDRVETITALRKRGYTDQYYVVVADDDPQLTTYRKNYGSQLITFSRAEAAQVTDAMDNQPNYRGVVYARNACFQIAQQLGLDYFLELDDDYNFFAYRYITADNRFGMVNSKRLNEVFELFLRFLDDTGALTVAMAQGGDFVGGTSNPNTHKPLLPKAMNSFFCKTSRPLAELTKIRTCTFVMAC